MARAVRRNTILVVEDDQSFRELITLHLLEAGYAVRAVADGVEAVRACLNSVPDLIVSDVHMPRLDGIDFVASIRSVERLRTVPVIFLTIDETAVDRIEAHRNVMFLRKPILASGLLRAVSISLGECREE